MKLMPTRALFKRSGFVTRTSTTLQVTEGGCAKVQSSPGILVRTARIAGYGFIAVGVVVGALALLSLLVGGLLVLPSVVSLFRRAHTRSIASRGQLRVVN
jgi:hypothetical protein